MPSLEILTSEYVRQLLSSMRTEAAVKQISRIVHAGTVLQINPYPEERNRRDFSNTPKLSDARLFQFTRSYSTSMTFQIKGTISDNDLYKVVLHRELGKIETLLGRLTSSWNKNPPKGIVHVPPLTITWNLHIPPVSDAISHQNLVVDAFQLQSLIDNSADVLDIGYAICSLATNLWNLGMIEDNLTLTLWSVDFWKKVMLLSPTINLNAWAYLAHELTNASLCYSNIGDRTEAYAKSQEAIDIITGKLDRNREAETLLAINLSTQARNPTTMASMNSIELATQAVFTLEKALSLQKEQLSIESQPIPSIVHSDSSSLHGSLYCYSRILLVLSYTQQSHGYKSDAHATHKRALSILHSLLREHPMSRRLLAKTASVAIHLCSPILCDFNTISENIAYAQEGTEKYRKLLESSFSTYIIPLLDALRSQSRIFLSAGMVQKSEKTIKEMIALSELASQTYQDLKLPSESDGDYQFHLASILHDENRSSEGLFAAHNAVEQYSALAFLDPDRCPDKLIGALIILCKILRKTNQHHSAVIEGFKALRLVDHAEQNDERIQKYANSTEQILLIDCIMDALAASPRDPGVVGKASTLIARFKKFSLSFDKFDVFTNTPAVYMEILYKNDLVDDAINYGQDFLSTWERKHTFSDSDYTSFSYLTCIIMHMDILKDHNRTHDALNSSTNAISVVRQCPRHHKDPDIHDLQRHLLNTHIRLLCSLGMIEEALDFVRVESGNFCSSEGTLADAHNGACQCVLDRLLNLATMQLYNNVPLQAIETAREAESISRIESTKSDPENTESLCALYRSVYISSDALFDAGRVSESLVRLTGIREGIQRIVDSGLQPEIVELDCLVLETIARLYFVQRDYTQPEELIIKVLRINRKLLAEDISHSVQLIDNLLFAAIASCCVNDHHGGVALLAELKNLYQRISVAHPALAREAEFNLGIQSRRGQWTQIQTVARETLTCNHVSRVLDSKMDYLDLKTVELEVVLEQ